MFMKDVRQKPQMSKTKKSYLIKYIETPASQECGMINLLIVKRYPTLEPSA